MNVGKPQTRLVTPGGSETSAQTASASKGPVRRFGLDQLGVLPFFIFVSLFLLWPTLVVVTGAFETADGAFTLQNLVDAVSNQNLRVFLLSIMLSAITAVAGAILGGLLAWAVATGPRYGLLRRAVLAASGTLAQFGGVMLAFGFLATFGFNGLVTLFLKHEMSIDIFAWGQWLYTLPGLALVYTYFQIPLMVIVFLPAIEGLRPQWREACETLGGGSLAYWRHVGFPILWPSFAGATLLLFANAFSAYSTAAALLSQADPLVTLRIGTFLTSEVMLGQENLGAALAFGMIVIVVTTTVLYAVLKARTSRWLA
ncbi:MAG: ABC transporter permease [Rhizobium sp.]|nr:MAG: ABC transporter permease [Rhizobium sp.]